MLEGSNACMERYFVWSSFLVFEHECPKNSWEPKGTPLCHPPQEIAGPNSRPYDQGNQWVFIVP